MMYKIVNKEKQKRILFLNIGFNTGGAERVLIDLVNSICDDYSISIASIEGGGDLKTQLRLDKIQTIEITSGKKNDFKFKLFYYLYEKRLLKYFYRFFLKGKYDIEVACFEGIPTNVISWSPKRTKKIAWVHTDLINNHGPDAAYKNDEEQRNAYKKFDHIICVSEGSKKQFHKRFPEINNVCVKYNIIDKASIIKKAELYINDESVNKRKYTIVTIGRLVQVKGYDRLLNIAERLKEKKVDFDLWIIGDGPMAKKLENSIIEKNLEDCVFLLGKRQNPYNILKLADLYVCSSYTEGYNTAVIEALLLEVPVVLTKCTGNEEVVKGYYGLLVENSEDALYAGIKKLCNSPVETGYWKEKAIEYSNNYSMDKQLQDIKEIFDK